MTNGTHSGSTAFITVDGPAGLRQRLEGGLIQAVNYPYLFIPLKGTPAEGRTAGDFAGQLVVIWNQMMERGVAKEKGKDGLVLFALRKSVVQNADSAVVPSDDALREAFRTAIAKALQRAWKKDQEAASEES